jgi:hypothetical protein
VNPENAVCVETCRSRLPASSNSSSANLRAPAIVITVFGDAIVPRGGSVWLGTLLKFFRGLDIDGGAMSRLAADGWLERNKVGGNSFYRLDKKGRQTFDTATRHIYESEDWYNGTLQPSFRHIKGGLTNLSTARGFSSFIEDKRLGRTGLPRHFLENSLYDASTDAEGLADLENAVSLCSPFHNARFHRGTNSTST